ncbi:MAG: cupin domain-containing protein [Thermoplasmata archaeon]
MPMWHDKPQAWHEILPGVRRRILAHGPSTMLVLYHIDPHRTFPEHAHPQAQSGTFLEGGGSFRVGESVWRLSVGDAYFVPPNVPHELVTEDAPSVILDVFAPGREDFLNEALPPDER